MSTLKNSYLKRNYRKRRLNRVFRTLVRKNKGNVTFREQPDRYYAHVYVKKSFWEAVSFLSAVNGSTKMAMVETLLDLGISRMLGTAIAENNQRMTEAENEEKKRRTKAIRYLIRWARSNGFEIERFF